MGKAKKHAEDSTAMATIINGSLSYKTMQEGMVILSCVRNVTEFSLQLEFPGLTFGYASIASISDPLSQFVKDRMEEENFNESILKNMFVIGSYVPAKLMNRKETEDNCKWEASVNPKSVNFEKRHNSFKVGMLIWACVQEELDHGFKLDCGVQNCTVFLPSKNIDEGKTLKIGQPVWCVVHKCKDNQTASILKVSVKSKDLREHKVQELESLHVITPGMKVDFYVEEVRKYGVTGRFLDFFSGYIDNTQLLEPLDTLEKIDASQIYEAYVLYLERGTNVTHLSLRGIETNLQVLHKNGETVTSQVLYKTPKGLFIQIGEKEKGFITNKRLLRTVGKPKDNNYNELIKKTFPVGSKRDCKILNYSYMEKCYICSYESDVMQKNLAPSELVPGKLLNVEVTNIVNNGLTVRTENMNGFVPNLHLTNTEYTEALKKKFSVGMRLKARVWSIEENNVLFTLKKALVHNETCLTDLKSIDFGLSYPGVIVQTKPDYAVVSFYGNISGIIDKKYLSSDENDSHHVNPESFFYRGQVESFHILSLKNEKLKLCLRLPTPAPMKPTSPEPIGKRIAGIIRKVHENGMDIEYGPDNNPGFVPVSQVGVNLSLCKQLASTMKEGDRLKNLICISNHPVNIFSSKEQIMMKDFKYKIYKFDTLKRGSLIRCFFHSKCESGCYVVPIVKNYTEKVFIESENIGTKDSFPKFNPQPYQSFAARVLKVDNVSKEIKLSLHLGRIFSQDIKDSIKYFAQYLREEKTLFDHEAESDSELTKYKVGQPVLCTVEKVAPSGCLVTLPNNAKGLVTSKLCPGNIRVGEKIKGVVLAHDFRNRYLDISLNSKINSKINKNQNGALENLTRPSFIIEKLLIKDEFILGVLKSSGNQQLVQIPRRLHENDFTCSTLSAYLDNKLKVRVFREGDKLVGISKKVATLLDRRYKKKQLLAAERNKSKLVSGGDIEASKKSKSPDNSDSDDVSDEESFKNTTQGSSVEDVNSESNMESDLGSSDHDHTESDDDDDEQSDIEIIVSDSDSADSTEEGDESLVSIGNQSNGKRQPHKRKQKSMNENIAKKHKTQ